MRKILIAFFLLVSIICSGQGVSLSFQPVDIGLGVRYDHLFKNFGLYTSVSKGSYKVDDNIYIKDHYKISGGIEVPTENGFISGGISYHKYGERKGDIRQMIFNPVSIEFGGGVFIGRFVCSIRMDFVKWEPTIDIGFIL